MQTLFQMFSELQNVHFYNVLKAFLITYVKLKIFQWMVHPEMKTFDINMLWFLWKIKVIQKNAAISYHNFNINIRTNKLFMLDLKWY